MPIDHHLLVGSKHHHLLVASKYHHLLVASKYHHLLVASKYHHLFVASKYHRLLVASKYHHLLDCLNMIIICDRHLKIFGEGVSGCKLPSPMNQFKTINILHGLKETMLKGTKNLLVYQKCHC